MIDETEDARRTLTAAVNTSPLERAGLEKQFGQVWNTEELARDYEVKGFAAPFAVVKRKADNAVGSLIFQHSPRFYFAFTKDGE